MDLDDELEKRLAGDMEKAVEAAIERIEHDKALLLNKVDAVIVVVMLGTIVIMIMLGIGPFAEGAVVTSNCCTLGARIISKRGV